MQGDVMRKWRAVKINAVDELRNKEKHEENKIKQKINKRCSVSTKKQKTYVIIWL